MPKLINKRAKRTLYKLPKFFLAGYWLSFSLYGSCHTLLHFSSKVIVQEEGTWKVTLTWEKRDCQVRLRDEN